MLGHRGEGIPFWMRRVDNRRAFAARLPGAATAMPRLELTPSEYIRRNVVVTTSGIDDPEVQFADVSHRTAERVFGLHRPSTRKFS